MRVDYVNLEVLDTGMWFVEGAYYGKSDQWDLLLLVEPGTSRSIDLHHRALKDPWSWENAETAFDVGYVGGLEAMEPYLEGSDAG